MNDFNTLIIQTRCKVILAHGDQPSLSMNESGEKANWVNVSIVNNQLIVYTKPEYYGYLLLHDYYPQITITYKTLTGLQMLDKCFVQSSETLILQNMGIVVGEGNLNIAVDAFSLDCTVIKSAYANCPAEQFSHVSWRISEVFTMDRNWKLRKEMCMPTTRPTCRYGLKKI